ncbi:MAG: Crp/Fnr family transcriptional regulator [Patescibacteria group bacterium]
MASEIEQKIAKHFDKYPLRSYPKGQILVFAGEDPEHIFYLIKGKVRQYDVSYRGDEVVVNVFMPPAFFPMSWAINKTPNKYFLKTEADTELRVIPSEDALEFIKSNPDVMLDLLSRLYRGVDGLMGRMVHLMSGTANSRLIYELIIECRRSKKNDEHASYDLTTNESGMAARSGLSRETISREMHKLKAEGLVKVTSKGIVVKDLAKLEQKLGAEI